jgi:hypothetical protein
VNLGLAFFWTTLADTGFEREGATVKWRATGAVTVQRFIERRVLVDAL